jgi:hypothetical protein
MKIYAKMNVLCSSLVRYTITGAAASTNETPSSTVPLLMLPALLVRAVVAQHRGCRNDSSIAMSDGLGIASSDTH